jgi:phosphoribosyl-AMP cyclohydrolase
MNETLENLKYDADGLIPAIVQDHATGEVLMMAWMNREAVAKTVETGQTHFYSRSRRKLWLKGETSGHVQQVKSLSTDCDKDTLLVKVEQNGAACHDGYYSCFYRQFEPAGDWKIVGRKVFEPEKVYR